MAKKKAKKIKSAKMPQMYILAGGVRWYSPLAVGMFPITPKRREKK